jgi:hypothetical protein
MVANCRNTKAPPTSLRGSCNNVSYSRSLQGKSGLTIGFRNIRHLGVGVYLAQIFLVAFWRSLDSIIAWVPVCGADLG